VSKRPRQPVGPVSSLAGGGGSLAVTATKGLGLPVSFAPLQPARKALFVDHNPIQCLMHLNDATLRSRLERSAQVAGPQISLYVELCGYALMEQQHYSQAANHFAQVNKPYLAGYCAMLAGDLEFTRQQWQIQLGRRQSHWCLHLFGLITAQLSSYPTFLQVRNHLEGDVAHLAQAGQDVSLTNLLAGLDTLAQSNPEAYKLAGRSLLNVGRLDEALPLLLKAQSVLPQDAEIYYHLGQYYQACHNGPEARLMLRQCLAINGHYTPARWLLNTVDSLAS
jgi:tetratricopeptide (TPR) repeat protein